MSGSARRMLDPVAEARIAQVQRQPAIDLIEQLLPRQFLQLRVKPPDFFVEIVGQVVFGKTQRRRIRDRRDADDIEVPRARRQFLGAPIAEQWRLAHRTSPYEHGLARLLVPDEQGQSLGSPLSTRTRWPKPAEASPVNASTPAPISIGS